MNIILHFNDAHQEFFDNYFSVSLQDDHHFFIEKIDFKDEIKISDFVKKKWKHNKTFNYYEYKRNLHILNTIKKNKEDIFLYFDVDIQFTRPIYNEVKRLLENKDLLFLKGGSGGINLGGLVIRSNEKTVSFFESFIQGQLEDGHVTGNQKLLKNLQLLGPHPQNPNNENRFKLKWDYLPEKKFACGHIVSYSSRYDLWKKIPSELFLHHANGTTGMENKIKQLDYVKKNYSSRNSLMHITKSAFNKIKYTIFKNKYLYSKYN